ncbi:MAG: hypothetical protein J6A16_04320 [Oscillospiraceae bacterium]|nr:hypothetical protein [Oscillospiraceae bacterium]
MKISKYPVKHTYKIPRLIADVLSLAVAVLIVSATIGFFGDYESQLDLLRIGQDNVETIADSFDPTIVWRQWVALVFPFLTLAVIAVYIILTLKSHRLSRYSVNKRNAQACYNELAFGISLAKLPVLVIIFDVMCVAHDKLLPFPKYGFSWFSWSLILYLLIEVIVIRYIMHRLDSITAKKESAPSETIVIRAVRSEKPSDIKKDTNKEDI